MIRLTKPYFDEAEIRAVKSTLDSGWVAGQGPKSKELEDYLQGYFGVKHAIAVNNCTAGIHLALLALGITEGDEVIISDYTFPAAGFAVLYCGGVPRFCDVRRDTFNIEPDAIEALINEKTRAIIVVHQFGLAADMYPILEIAAKYDLRVIEDAACAVGAKYKGKMVGTFGEITTFSFHARKNITGGEGGVVVTDNDEYAATIRALSSFGMKSALSREKEFSIPTFDILGYNYKLSDISCAILIEQFKKYDPCSSTGAGSILCRMRELAKQYNRLLGDNEFISLQKEDADYYNVYQTYSVVLDERIDRNKMIVKMLEEEIQTTIGTYSSHIQPVYKSSDKCPNSLFLYKHSISLPLYYELQESEVEKVAATLIRLCRQMC